MDNSEIISQLSRLTERVKTMVENQEKMGRQIEQLTAQANRWRGAFVVVLTLGGIVGWFFDKIAKVFH